MEKQIVLTIRLIDIVIYTDPKARIVVDMEDQNATAGQTGIPTFFLAILHELVFILEAVVANEIGSGLISQSRHLRDAGSLSKFYWGEPSHKPPLVS